MNGFRDLGGTDVSLAIAVDRVTCDLSALLYKLRKLPILWRGRDHHKTATLHHLIRIARCKSRIAITVYETWSVVAHNTLMC